VAGCASVDDTKFRQPDLMDTRLEAATKRIGITAIVDQRQIVPLITMPLAEVFLCRRDGKRQQQGQADNAKCPHRITEEGLARGG
jgi:hypothetical protein